MQPRRTIDRTVIGLLIVVAWADPVLLFVINAYVNFTSTAAVLGIGAGSIAIGFGLAAWLRSYDRQSQGS